MAFFKEIIYEKINKQKNLILVADIGGTHTGFGVLAEDKKKLKILITLHFRSKDIKNFTKTLKEVIEHLKDKHNAKISRSCFAGAGIISERGIELTNLPWNVNIKEIKKKIRLQSPLLINDFQAVAYGIEELPKKSIIIAKKGRISKGAPIALIGAGTGLGKAILIFDKNKKRHVTFPSEGGHGDLPALDDQELKLRQFIRKKNSNDVVEWEDVLSGRGLSNIYNFLGNEKKYGNNGCSREIENFKYDSMTITKYKNKDMRCKDTFKLFLKFYGRCAKDFALDVLAEGGVYLAGGIAINNSDLFKRKEFKDEFVKSKKQKKLLEKIPVFVIKDYNVSLYGAAAAVLRRSIRK